MNAIGRINATGRTGSSKTYLIIGGCIVVIIGVLIYLYWGKITGKLSTEFDSEIFIGTHLGVRVYGDLSELINYQNRLNRRYLQSYNEKGLTACIVDCSNNIIWKTGDPDITTKGEATYTIIDRYSEFHIQYMTNKSLVNFFSLSEKGSIIETSVFPSTGKLKSFILTDTLIDLRPSSSLSEKYSSLSDQDYVKKIMSHATHEYPVNAC